MFDVLESAQVEALRCVEILQTLRARAARSHEAKGPRAWLELAYSELQEVTAPAPFGPAALMRAAAVRRVQELLAEVDEPDLAMAPLDWLDWATTRVTQLAGPLAVDEQGPWSRVVPALWWPEARAYVVADRHLADGTRQHLVRGQVPAGTVVANAQVFGDAYPAAPVLCTELSHLSCAAVLAVQARQ